MPRTARLDAPGFLHHVMIRGIERREIFRNNTDRENFIDRLEILCPVMLLVLTTDTNVVVSYFRTASNLLSAKKMPIFKNWSGIST